jgi:hypothetical protein
MRRSSFNNLNRFVTSGIQSQDLTMKKDGKGLYNVSKERNIHENSGIERHDQYHSKYISSNIK